MSGIAAVSAAAAIVGGWWTAGPLNHGRLIMAAQSWPLKIMAAQSWPLNHGCSIIAVEPLKHLAFGLSNHDRLFMDAKPLNHGRQTAKSRPPNR
jgi:hypothetical protein